MRLIPTVIAAIALPLAGCGQTDGSASINENAATVPNLSGLWAREFLGFEQPDSGQGPIANLARIPTGQSDIDNPVGDFNSPLLKPAAAGILTSRGELQQTRKNF